MENTNNLFSFKRIIPNIIIVIIILALYYLYLHQHSYFLEWDKQIGWAVKIILAYEILESSARSLLAPIFTLLIGFVLYAIDFLYQIDWITSDVTWEVIIIALLGFLVTIIVKV